MAPGITTGHDGVLVVTDRRLRFVGLRHTLSLPYEEIEDITVRGRHLGARLIVSTADGKSVISGIAPRHAAEIAESARGRIGVASS